MYRNTSSWPSASVDVQLWSKNTVFNPCLVDKEDTKPRCREHNCLFTENNLCESGPGQFESMLFKGQLYTPHYC